MSWVSNICHLYPKRKYKSVAEDNDNIIYLTADEHTRFDYLLDTMDFSRLLDEFINVWLLAARRMRDLAPRVEEDGKLKPDYYHGQKKTKHTYSSWIRGYK